MNQYFIEVAGWQQYRLTMQQHMEERLHAEQCAHDLLYSLLSTPERRILTRYGHLRVASRLHPPCVYYITSKLSYVVHKGRTIGYLCVQPDEQYCLPPSDHILLKKLWLEADEAGCLAVSNLWRDKRDGEFIWPGTP